jgi:hypothetical protein
MESHPTVRIVFWLVVLLTGTAVATPATGLAMPDVDAQSSGDGIEDDEMRSISDRQTAFDWVGTTGRVCHPRGTAVGVDDSTTTLNVSYTFRRLPERAGVVGVTMRLPRTPGVDRVSITGRHRCRALCDGHRPSQCPSGRDPRAKAYADDRSSLGGSQPMSGVNSSSM